MEATESLGDVSLRGLSVAESERTQRPELASEILGRAGRKGTQHLGPDRPCRASQRERPDHCVLVVVRLLDVSIVHLDEIFEYKSKPAQAEAVKFLKDGL